MTARVSFVVASYNGALFIKEQLASILAILGPDDEIIVSDDGSTDETIRRIEELQDDRIRLLVGGPRLGYQDNFARAIAASSGDYVFFSDQDDVCLPARVPRSLEALAKDPCVCGDAIVVDETLTTLHPSHFRQRQARFGTGSLILRPAVIGATLACRRPFLVAQLPFPKHVPHDQWLTVQAARRDGLAVINEPFILYRRHRAALSATGAASKRPLSHRLADRLRLVGALVWRHLFPAERP